MSAPTLDLESAAALVGLHTETLRRLAKRGAVPGAKPGKSWIFIADDLLDWLRAQYRGQAAQPSAVATVQAPPPIVEPSRTHTARQYERLLSRPADAQKSARQTPSRRGRSSAPAGNQAMPSTDPSVSQRYAELLARRPAGRG